MNNKNFTKMTPSQKDIVSRIMDYCSNNLSSSPWRNDYIILRMSQEASNESRDIIFIPNHNDSDEFDFYSPYKCNAFTSDAVKIISGFYDYRLGARFGIVYGQQMGPIHYQNTVLDYIHTDYMENRLVGVNLIAHPIHSLIPLLTPISNASKGSVTIHPSAHRLLKQNFKDKMVTFKLYVVDIDLLL